jgi:hypothetical protein
MNTSLFRKVLIAALFGVTHFAALASGTEGVSGAETSDAQMYNIGKSVYSQKLGCANCPMAGKTLNATLAKEILSGSQATQGLTVSDKSALTSYLKRRFKLQ